MRPMRFAALFATAALLFGTAAGSGAAESVDVGATASSPSSTTPCGLGTTFFQDATAVPPSYTTTAGVVTSWSSMASTAANPGIVELKVAREGPADTYTITGSTEPEPLVTNRLNSFRTRISVQAGDVLALYVPQGAPPGCAYSTGNAGDVVRYVPGPFPDPAVGGVIATTTSTTGVHMNVSARIEPDADGDGYGDLTQDACPALKNSHDDCVAPNTFVKTAPKRLTTKGSTAKAKIVFFSSEDGSTFTCTVDGGPAKPCKSAFKVRLKPGKHTVTICAFDRVGNVDPTPAKVKVKVTKA